MPTRFTPLATNQIYHVVNRGSNSIPIFNNAYEYKRFIALFSYYRNKNVPFRYSELLALSNNQRSEILKDISGKKNYWVKIVAYCLMPNHYHFLLKQICDEGIQNFIRLLSNSYSRYFNTKRNRRGPLFEGRFKAVLIHNEEQLLHVGRYIHLNPYSSYLVKNMKDVFTYPYSSLSEYVGEKSNGLCNKKMILSCFSTIENYKKFILDRADYQRSIEAIKHLSLE